MSQVEQLFTFKLPIAIMDVKTSSRFIGWLREAILGGKHKNKPYFFYGPSNSGKTTIASIMRGAFRNESLILGPPHFYNSHLLNTSRSVRESKAQVLFIEVENEEKAIELSRYLASQNFDFLNHAILIVIDGDAHDHRITSRGFSTLRTLEDCEQNHDLIRENFHEPFRRLVMIRPDEEAAR